jgi:hypothetical protein
MSVLVATRPANLEVVYLFWRLVDSGGNGYIVEVWRDDSETDYWLVYRIDATVWTLLDVSATQEVAVGGSVGVRFQGTTHSLMYRPPGGDWTLVASFVEATHSAAGQCQIGASDDVARLDDFSAGTTVGTSSFALEPSAVFEWDGVPEIWVEPPGEFEMAVTLSVDFNIGVSLDPGTVTFDSGDIAFTGGSTLTNAGLTTFDAAAPAMSFLYGLGEPGHIVCDGGVITATGFVTSPVGRNKHPEQLPDAGPGDLVRGSIGTPGSTS